MKHGGTSFAHIWLACKLGALVTCWFLLLYGGADWLTGRHSWRVLIAMPWERSIPYVPAAVVGYMSIYPLFLMAPLVLQTSEELGRFARTLLILITISGAIFVLVPAELAYEPRPSAGGWQRLMTFADALNLRFNLAPSLHVGLSVACIAVYAKYARRWQAAALWAWAVVIAASTLLIHEHHVVDVVSGWTLALLSVRWFFGVRAPAAEPPTDRQSNERRHSPRDPDHPPGPGEERIIERAQRRVG